MFEKCADLVADAYSEDAAYTSGSGGQHDPASLFNRCQRYDQTLADVSNPCRPSSDLRQTISLKEAAKALTIMFLECLGSFAQCFVFF